MRRDDQIPSRLGASNSSLRVVMYHSGEAIPLKEHVSGVVEYQITDHLVRIAVIYPSQSISLRSSPTMLTIDCITRRSTKPIYTQNLYEASLFFKPLHLFLIGRTPSVNTIRGVYLAEPEDSVVASKSDDMGDHAELFIIVHEEGRGFPVDWVGSHDFMYASWRRE